QTEQALRQSEEQLRQIAENMSQVLWMCSADDKPIYLSPAFERVWGLPCSDWYADIKVWDRAIHPDDQERVLPAMRGVIDRGFDEDYRIIRPDGAVRIIRDRGFPIRNEAGDVYRVAGIAEDITERRQEQQNTLAAIERLAEVGELTAMIVHEVRNPLTTVMMGLESFRRLDLTDASKQRLELALEEAQRLRSLLNEILLYAKPQTLEQTELELNTLIASLLESLRTMPSALQRRVRWQPASQPVRVRGDVDKLKQVVINLVNNACEAVAPKSAVTCRVTVSTDGGHPHACLSVHNPGAIPAEIVPELTKPFYTTKSSGTGLGLAIVKRIVDAHQGELAIASSEEEGTTVLVRLPVVLVAQSSAPDIK
ncbi:MAG TPA: ATP-binding protein, partial [Chroococcidiopsis sp.]